MHTSNFSSDEESDAEEDLNVPSDTHSTPSSKDSIKTTTFEAMFPCMHQVYGVQPEALSPADLLMLRR